MTPLEEARSDLQALQALLLLRQSGQITEVRWRGGAWVAAGGAAVPVAVTLQRQRPPTGWDKRTTSGAGWAESAECGGAEGWQAGEAGGPGQALLVGTGSHGLGEPHRRRPAAS